MTLTANQEAWVTALESGDYKQTGGYLQVDDEYCCLGVACDISGLGSWGEPDEDDVVKFTEHDSRGVQDSDLGPDVVRWLRLRSSLGYFDDPDVTTGLKPGYEALTEMNDDGKWSFIQIAKFIRKHPEWVFE